MTMTIFQERLKGRRKELGFTQEQLADSIGIPGKHKKQIISRYEAKGIDPDLDTLRRLAAALNCSVDWLIGVPDAPKTIDSSRGAIMKAYSISEAAAKNLEKCSIEYHYVLDRLLSMSSFVDTVSDLNKVINRSLWSLNNTDKFTLLPPTPEEGEFTGFPFDLSAKNLRQFFITRAFSSLQKGFIKECEKVRMNDKPEDKKQEQKGGMTNQKER